MMRTTALAEAFVKAAANNITSGDANPDKGTGNWIARRAALNTERPNFGMVYEGRKVDHRPASQFGLTQQLHPRVPASLPRNLGQAHREIQSFKDDAKLDNLVQVMADVFLDTHESLHGTAHLQAQLTDDEVAGLD
jgi:hypothetical protein